MPRIIAKVAPDFKVPKDIKPVVVLALRRAVAEHFAYPLKGVEFIWDYLEEAENVPSITFDVMFSYKITQDDEPITISTVVAMLAVLDVTTDMLRKSLLEKLAIQFSVGNMGKFLSNICACGGRNKSFSAAAIFFNN